MDTVKLEYLHFALTIVVAACTVFFGLVGWAIRLAVKRAIDKFDAGHKSIEDRFTKLEKTLDDEFRRRDEQIKRLEDDFQSFKEWTRTILAVAGLVTIQGGPNPRKT